MNKKLSFKNWLITAALSAFFISSSQIQQSIEVFEHETHCTNARRDEKEAALIIETFLLQKVPGMDISYNEVIKALIEEGQQIWISGGILRDLLGTRADSPHDLDFSFSGTPEDIGQIAENRGWLYSYIPGSSEITIGDRKGIFMEGVPKSYSVDTSLEAREFTINTIYYHCNSSTFVPESKEGLSDLEKRALRIQSPKWHNWLFAQGVDKYSKIFRFWKMAGKGYFFSKDLENFFIEETMAAFKEDKKNFKKNMFEYLSEHYSSFEQVEMGCRLVMGEEWAFKNVSRLRNKAFKKDQEFEKKLRAHTKYPNTSMAGHALNPTVLN